MKNTHDTLEVLQEKFGYHSFWPNQEAVINAILEGHNAVVIMPTGGGKSIVFQIPALLLEGLTIVISPLISLMKDQVDALKANGIAAEYFNSMLSYGQKNKIIRQVQDGELDLLYLSPETLLMPATLEFLKNTRVAMFAIDEAHCISIWGHDFREEYTKLKSVLSIFPDARIVALTATADRVTREDIIEQLCLKDPKVFIASFDRPNLSLNVYPAQRRFESIYRFIQERPGQSGIIYCLSRKGTEELARKLINHGIDASHYHAGMPRDERNKAQEDFIHDRVQIVCATIAFGMGIDKSNVRFVIHYNLPKNIEGYYQEIGRAGRDGAPADTVLYYSYGDVMTLKNFAMNSGQPEIQLAKLERMQQYAEAQTCRRKILLSYFNEYLEEDCGNCDVCIHPPTKIDGTIFAQKAISAVYRLKQEVAAGMLIDVLRGSNKREIFEKGYHNIKTFGAGRHTSYFEWQQYLMQMVHQGLLEIDYKDHQKIKVTELGKKFIFEKKHLSLVQYVPYQAKKKKTVRTKKLTKKEKLRNQMYAKLLALRSRLAEQEGIPPYTVLSDANLQIMAEKRPAYVDQIRQIPGISVVKLEKYGAHFLKEIRTFKVEHKDKQSTQLVSFMSYLRGQSIQEIANERNLAEATIISHLALAHEWGEEIGFTDLIEEEMLQRILEAIDGLGVGAPVGQIAGGVKHGVAYRDIYLALAEYKRLKRKG